MYATVLPLYNLSTAANTAATTCRCRHHQTHTDTRDVKVWEAHNSADTAAAAAAAAGSAAEADAAEALLEQQLERMLEEGAAAHAADTLMDDYMDSDDDAAAADSTSSSSSSSDSDGDGNNGSRRQRARRTRIVPNNSSHKAQQQQQQQPKHKQQKQMPAVSEPPPPSFSQVDLSLPEAQLRREFPRFPGVDAASVVVLQAGDMLFLPAGWFHEVTSFGGAGESCVLCVGVAEVLCGERRVAPQPCACPQPCQSAHPQLHPLLLRAPSCSCCAHTASGLDGGHLAVNFWFHPPDNLDPGKAGFKNPYTSPYYPSVWANRRGWVQAETRAWWQQQQQRRRQQKQQQQQLQNGLPQQQQPHQKQQQQSANKRRRIKWSPTVGDPGNVYEAFNTRAGTATGSYKVLPQHSGLVR